MKFTIEKAAAVRALTAVVGSVTRKSTIPILSCVRLDLAGAFLTVTGTDLDLQIAVSLQVHGSDSGSTCIDGQRLFDIARAVPDGAKIELSPAENDPRMIVRAGRSRFQLGQLPADDFPVFKTDDPVSVFEVQAADLTRLIALGGFATAREVKIAHLTAVHLSIRGGQLRARSTDGKRMASCVMAAPEEAELDGAMIAPPAIAALRKLLDAEPEGAVEIAFLGRMIRFTVGASVLTTKLLDGQFPDAVESIIASKVSEPLTADCDLLTGCLDRCLIVADDKSKAVRFDIAGGQLKCSAGNTLSGDAGSEEMDIDWSGEDFHFICSGDWLREIVGLIKTENVLIAFGVKGPKLLKITETGAPDWLAFMAPQAG